MAMTSSAKAKMKREPDMTAIYRKIDETMQPTAFHTGSGQRLNVNRASHDRAREMLPELNDNMFRHDELDNRPGTPYDFVDGGVVMTSFMWPYNLPSLNEPLWLIPPTREQLLADPTLGQAFTQHSIYQQHSSSPQTFESHSVKESSMRQRRRLIPIGEHALVEPVQPAQQAVDVHNARSSASKAFQAEAVEGHVVSTVKCQVEKRFTMSKKEASALSSLEQNELIDWDLRIVKESNNQPISPSSLFIVANDLGPAINIRHGNVSSYLGSAYDTGAMRRVMRFEANRSSLRRPQMVLSLKAAYKLIEQHRSDQSGTVWGLLQQHFNSYAAPDLPNESFQSTHDE